MKTIENRIARTIVLVVSLMMSFSVFGQNDNSVDLNHARCVGENFIKLNPDIKLSGESSSLKRVETDKFPNLYIFNVEGGGSIIVAGDKRVQPILGFSDEGTFDPNNLPPAAEMIIGCYDYVVDSVVRNNIRVTDETIVQAWKDLENGYYQEEKCAREEETDYPLVYWPIITTTWNQGSLDNWGWQGDYNNYCPVYEDVIHGINVAVKALTGCGATAMAQLMYYYKRKPQDIQNKTINLNNVPTEIPAFTGSFSLTGNLQLRLDRIDVENHRFVDCWGDGNLHWFEFHNWEYPSNYVQIINETECAAKMMYYCGLRIASEYKVNKTDVYNNNQWIDTQFTGETTSYLDDIRDVLRTSFIFPDTFIKSREYDDVPNWDDTLKKYISHNVPLIYRGQRGIVSGTGAHFYIIDGYITTPIGVYFHHNLGWGGQDDDYYFSIGYPGSYGASPYPYYQWFLSTKPIKDKCKPNLHCLNTASKSLRDNQATNQIIYESVTKYHDYMDAMSHHISRILCGTYWDDEDKGIAFWNLFQSLLDSSTGMMPEGGMQQLISQNEFEAVSEDFIRAMVDRYNQSVLYWNEGYYTNESLPEGYDNMLEYDTAAMRKAYEAQAYAESLGFNDVRQMYDNAYEMLEAEVNHSQSSVCAKVTVKFSQKASMTREAFNGILQIFNGHESIPMQNILVEFRIKDAQGNDCTNLFQINTLSLDSITGISGDGSLAAQTNGTALVQFIPTRNAAPTQPVVYSFGGSFSFIDPFTGEGLTYSLYPVEIVVNPSPDLHIDYFMQRDILGDDALTTDKVEPSIPAELAVIINNRGAGMAKNVTLETAEPQIVDNEKGLAIQFKMCGSSLNGIERQLGLHGIPFGNIESGQKMVGEWLFTSSLLGHFISYNANVVHNSSFGNLDLSLVSHLDIHELIHPIYAYGNLDDGINDFLVNDVPDAYDTPDSIYFSHGGKTSVGVADSISFDHYVSPTDTIVNLTVIPSSVGWNYGKTEDPGMNQYDLVSCIRNNDNQEIPLNNVWQTFVTIPDGGDPVYENKLHIVDTLAVQQTTSYTLVYTLKPNLLCVEEIVGIPTESFIEYPLTSFQVKFNEPIIDSTFTYEDMTLKCQNGPNLMNPTVGITRVNDSLYNVNIEGLTNESGYYVLNVNANEVKDTRGYNGYNGKQASWVQVLTSITQAVNMQLGWNWWSTNIEQNGIDGLTMLENSLGHNGVTIKSQYDFVENYYQYYGEDFWFGSLEGIANEQGYLVDVTQDCSPSMTGVSANPSNHPITIQPNWNWIGYPVALQQSVASALASYNASPDDLIKSHYEFSTFYDGFGWFPDDLIMTPGQGYFYYSNATGNQTITYANDNREEALPEKTDLRQWRTNVHRFADNISIVAVMSIDSVEQRGEDLELGAFVNGECRGSARLRHFGPTNRYYAMLSVTGLDGEEVTFGFVNKEKGESSMVSENRVIFMRNDRIGSLDEPYIVRFNTNMGDGFTEEDCFVVLFPNPVMRNQTFSLEIPHEEILKEFVVVDMLGAEVRHQHGAVMCTDIKGLPVAGVYLVKAVTQTGRVYYGRLIVE